MAPRPLHRVVIAGGGVAGLEGLIALRAMAGDDIELTLLSPADRFTVRAMEVGEPFGRPSPAEYRVPDVCADHGATFRGEPIEHVRPESRTVSTPSGDELAYDSLLLAVGARAVSALAGTTTFRGAQDTEAMRSIVGGVERGVLARIAFVVPPGVAWTLPLYELALMTAERAHRLGMHAALTIVTPEEQALGMFGRTAAAAVATALARAEIATITGAYADAVERGAVLDHHGEVITEADQVVALPRVTAPYIAGVPADRDGFIPVDEYGRVAGCADVFAAGDATSFPVKQGGLAAQQADVAARCIAARAGAAVLPRRFRPVIEAKLLTGAASMYLREALTGGQGAESSVASGQSSWWPPSKVAAPYLAPYLDTVDRKAPSARA
jgi:sulfide:quinone oxidoreductase